MELTQANTNVKGKAFRLLHVGPLPPPWSGMGVHIQNFLEAIPICDQKNLVLNTSIGALPGDPTRLKLPTLARMMRHLNLAARAYKMIKNNQVQVVHLNGSSHDLSFLGNYLIVVGAKLAGARVVWHLHEDLSVALFPGKRMLTRMIFVAVTWASDVVAVMTAKDREIVASIIPRSKVVVLSPTCSPDFLKILLERQPGPLRVLYVGWLTKAKGIFDLFQVALRIQERIPGVSFNILGTGMSDEETKAVYAFVETNNLQDRVHLSGVVVGEAKQQQFADAHVLFMPTQWDAFPVTVLEAMAAGLPVLGTKVGGLPLMLEEGKGALLTKVGDVTGMIEDLVTLAKDESLRFSMGQANRERFLSLYHPEQVGVAAFNVYRRLTESSTCAESVVRGT